MSLSAPSVSRRSSGQTPIIRKDVVRLSTSQASQRQVLVWDPLAKTFTRIDREQWESLTHGGTGTDPEVMAALDSAGLLRSRTNGNASNASWKKKRGGLGQLFSIRLPGFESAGLAGWLAGRSGWLFSPLAVLLWMMWIAAVALAVPIYWGRFQANLPGLQEFFSSGNALLLMGTMVVTKAIHELAHATACSRLGARPGQIGILLLCGAPCPYCDVTDSWRLPSMVHRAAIMLAGVYVEWIIASLAMVVWWWSDAGLLHFAALNVVVVCGVSSLLFNLNPLMRYDGYYVLSDLCDSSNLRVEASEAFSRVVMRRLAGPGYHAAVENGSREWWLSAYHLGAVVYRTMIVLVIAYWLVGIADAISLRPLGVSLASVMLLAIPLNAGKRMWGTVRGAGKWRNVANGRRVALVAVALGLGVALVAYPLPDSFTAKGTVDVTEAVPVFLPDRGQIAEVGFDYGDRVSKGETLVRLNNPQLNLQARQVTGQWRTMQIQTVQLRRRAIEQTELLTQWDQQQAALKSLDERNQAMAKRIDALQVVAPCDGVLLPVLETDQAALPGLWADEITQQRAERSLHWSKGAWAMDAGYWCRIGDPNAREVVLEIDADLRSRVRIGDRLMVRCDQSPEQILRLQVDSISTQNRSSHSATGTQTQFQVSCRLPNDRDIRWQMGAGVTAKLQTPPRSIFNRLQKHLSTFLYGERYET